VAESGCTVSGGNLAEKMAAWTKALDERLKKATQQNAVALVGAVKEGILDGAPGGHPFKALHPFTLAQRAGGEGTTVRDPVTGRFIRIGGEGGGDANGKRLLDHGDLVGAITYVLSPDGLSARIGVLRNAKGPDGESINNIAQIQTEGRVIGVTPKMRAWLHAHGLHLSPNTFIIIIPPAPFIAPAYHAQLDKMKARYRAALQGK
jgi:hypothetical protein